jgi:hypothetical protein
MAIFIPQPPTGGPSTALSSRSHLVCVHRLDPSSLREKGNRCPHCVGCCPGLGPLNQGPRGFAMLFLARAAGNVLSSSILMEVQILGFAVLEKSQFHCQRVQCVFTLAISFPFGNEPGPYYHPATSRLVGCSLFTGVLLCDGTLM